MTCTRGTPAWQAAAACCAFESISGAKPALSSLQQRAQLRHEHLSDQLATVHQAVG